VQRPKGCERHDDAGLHVEYAGAPEASVSLTERHGFEGSEGPDRVEVAEQEQGLLAAAGGAEAKLKDVAEPLLFVHLGGSTEGCCDLGDERVREVDRGGIVAGGFLLDEALEEVHHPGALGFDVIREGSSIHGAIV
jgi:hypothetical protein